MATTLSALAFAATLFALATWRARQPREVGELRYIPWTGIQTVAVVIAIVALAHLITLLTGKPFAGRMG